MKRAAVVILAMGLLAGTARAASDEATGAYLDGLDALAVGKYSEADRDFGKAIAADEGNVAYYKARGVARTLAEDFPGALKDLEMAKKLGAGRDWEIEGWIGVASKMGGNPAVGFAPGMAGQANRDYAVAMSEMAQNYWGTRNGGQYFDKSLGKMVESQGPYKGDFGRVAAYFVARHQGVAGASSKMMLKRIQARIAAKDYANVLAKLDALIAANPDDLDLLQARASALLVLGDAADARPAYTDLLTRQLSTAGYVGRAEAATKLGDIGRAKRDIADARQLSPEQLKGVVFQAEEAPLIPPPDPHELWRKLESQARGGASPEQLRDTALQLVTAMGALRIRYDERYQQHLVLLENSLREKPDDPDREVRLARFLHDEEQVLEEQVGPRAEPVPYRHQSAADLKREQDRAAQLEETALRNHPDNLAALTFKAQGLVDAGDFDDAKPYVVKALSIKGGDDADLLELLAGLLQIDAALNLSAAGNLKQIKTWSQTDFNQSPPVIYTFWRWPNKEELAQAAELEQQAKELMDMAQRRIEQAAGRAGATALGFYYKANLQRIRTDLAGAKISITKAVELDPGFVQAWFVLAGICTQQQDADGAVAARAKAYSLAQTTASAELNSLWYKIPHAQFKGARETVAEGVGIDPADARLPAYLAVVDEATDKPAEALAHYRMAGALCDAQLTRHGVEFGVRTGNGLVASGELAGEAAAVRMRVGLLLLDQGKPREAAREFEAVAAAMAMLSETSPHEPLQGALLPNPDLPAGAVPLAQTATTLRLRAAAGVDFCNWAAAGRDPQDSVLAGKTYRRMLVSYNLATENLAALKGMIGLGLAELHLHRGEMDQAAASMKDTPAVPQDFWQEMRQTEAAIHAPGRGR